MADAEIVSYIESDDDDKSMFEKFNNMVDKNQLNISNQNK